MKSLAGCVYSSAEGEEPEMHQDTVGFFWTGSGVENRRRKKLKGFEDNEKGGEFPTEKMGTSFRI